MPAYQAVPRFPESTVERMRHAAQQVTAWVEHQPTQQMEIPRRLRGQTTSYMYLDSLGFMPDDIELASLRPESLEHYQHPIVFSMPALSPEATAQLRERLTPKVQNMWEYNPTYTQADLQGRCWTPYNLSSMLLREVQSPFQRLAFIGLFNAFNPVSIPDCVSKISCALMQRKDTINITFSLTSEFLAMPTFQDILLVLDQITGAAEKLQQAAQYTCQMPLQLNEDPKVSQMKTHEKSKSGVRAEWTTILDFSVLLTDVTTES